MTLASVWGMALAAGCSLAHAQVLNDPTRPPGVSPAGSAAEVDARAGATQLQSILLSPGRKLAVINGQTVPLGGRIGDATLLAISETGVVLKRGAEVETLRLLPDVDKKPARPAAVRGKGGDTR